MADLTSFGLTRSVLKRDHLLQAPDSFVRAALPGMVKAVGIVHIAPAAGAGFAQYTAEMEAGGQLGQAVGQRFCYVLEGSAEIVIESVTYWLRVGGYAYLPAGCQHRVGALEAARVMVIEKEYVRSAEFGAPAAFVGHEEELKSLALGGDEALQVKAMIPEGGGLDFAVNTMRYEPGASLSLTEVHVMEHGLLMLEGGGIYRLGDGWYPVTAGDFIWMAPYCPQWFAAVGKTAAKYLIYKDWGRHPLAR
jgi:(S)-ureidoglycine aminohydrolase